MPLATKACFVTKPPTAAKAPPMLAAPAKEDGVRRSAGIVSI
eukprot:CAMPEP_0115676874 /NCGR_PEP_ID=MMETSP0272-20121206/54922_1 /TAXON_ID=71861 /ORGANISM="Scrippsiella trochoidea, Strain CCMP3099" /LENGTH=41 /DNA_ID= /DNA_START= /DNA_END= /DNA_ORIENTATION=